jgi:hypothetical protein
VSYLRSNGKIFCVGLRKPVDRGIKRAENNTLMMERIQPSEMPKLYHTIHIHSLFCLTTGPNPIPKRLIQRERPIATSFNFYYHLFSLMLSSSCLRNLPRFPVTFTLPPIYPSSTCFRRQFLCKIWPIQLAFLLFIACRLLLSSLTLSYDS